MSKQSIQGKRISQKEAYKGLGDPKTWAAYEKKLEREFRAKPVKSKLIPK